ncbi:vWA-like protein [Dioscorea alata]|uniref:VWA-like protein n=1 Tax=Dioscorea alata TaxID=55571 RepID=A0ACB7UPX6_DIOAL|nr:vWA-like protein [Dioscorea alata]
MHLVGEERKANLPGQPSMAFPAIPQTLTPFVSDPEAGFESSTPSGTATPFLSSGPVSGPRPLGVSQTQTTMQTFPSRPMSGYEMLEYRMPSPPPAGPSSTPMPSYLAQGASSYQQLSPFPVLPTAQAVQPLRGPSLGAPPFPAPTGSFRPQTQISSVPLGAPPQIGNSLAPKANMSLPTSESSLPPHKPFSQSPWPGNTNAFPSGNVPQPPLESQFPSPRPVSQSPLQAYSAPYMPLPMSETSLPPHKPFSQSPWPGNPNAFPSGNVPQPPLESQFPSPRPVPQPPLQAYSAPYVPPQAPPLNVHQGSYVPPAPLGFNSREQMQYSGTGPQLEGTIQGLLEDFQSLSVGSSPGMLDQGIDPETLPRPLDVDQEPISVLEKYPLNCHPRYLRLTTHAIPSSQSLLSRWHLPLGAVVHPLAEAPDGEEVQVVNVGCAGVIRCRRCQTYVNPYVTFMDAGRKWWCNLCSLLNDVPGEYFCPLDANGRRCDVDQRPELSRGSVEFAAPAEYMRRPPIPPIYFFLIDVSLTAVQNGFLETIATTIKSCLDGFPGSPRTLIAFLTFDSRLHFYSLKSSLSQPQMMVVSDLEDIFLPMHDDLLVNLADSRTAIDTLLDSLPSMFQHTVDVESALGPALLAAHMIMRQLGGKLLVFQNTLPSLGVGRLRLRGNDLCIHGTDKEHTLRIPEEPFYKQMAAEFTKNHIAVDIYAFSDKYSDIASLGSLAKYTGGQVYYYPSFQATIHGQKLRYELTRNLTRETAWEAVMRIRCGKGLRFTTYHGHFMVRSTDFLELPAVDCDKAFAMQFSLDETLITAQTIYFQVALLYTSSSGERRIRVHTAAAPVVSDLGEMYRQADSGAIVSMMSRLAIEKTLSGKLEDARQFLQLKLMRSLREYRNLYVVQHRLGGRLIYPESLKYLALYILSLCKTLALRGGYAEASPDERCAAGYSMMILPIGGMLKLLYPTLVRIDEILLKAPDNSELLNELKSLPLTKESLDAGGLYLYNDGFSLILWCGRMLSAGIVKNILGIDFSTSPDLSKVTLFEHDNEISRKLTSMLTKIRKSHPYNYQLCHIVRQDEQPRETSLLLSNLVEDQTAGTFSYRDWMLQIFLQTQQIS